MPPTRCIGMLESHVSIVRSLSFSEDGNLLISAGRDKIINVWDIRNFSLQQTIPVYEVCYYYLLALN
jgi:U3 small nucleolar RNA-associated protein 13